MDKIVFHDEEEQEPLKEVMDYIEIYHHEGSLEEKMMLWKLPITIIRIVLMNRTTVFDFNLIWTIWSL